MPVLQPRLPGEGLAGAARAAPHGREALQVLQVRPRLCRARHAQPAPAHQRSAGEVVLRGLRGWGRGRGWALTGLPAAGGCLLEVEELLVSEESPAAAAAVLAEDPHTVLVEFSSVVADTQEYIIEVGVGPLGRAGPGPGGQDGLTSAPPSRPPQTTRRPAKPRRSSRAPRQR